MTDTNDDIPDFLKGFAAKKPDNGWTRFQEMCDRLRELNEKMQSGKKDKV